MKPASRRIRQQKKEDQVGWTAVELVLELAISDLFSEDKDLFFVGINERSLTHRLAFHINQRLGTHVPGRWHIDCEYNRLVGNPKRLNLPIETTNTADTEATTIYPDIVVHRRTKKENLLVIEVKKRQRPSILDTAKLIGLTSAGDYNYRFGLFIGFLLGEKRVARAILYENGRVTWDSDSTLALDRLLISG